MHLAATRVSFAAELGSCITVVLADRHPLTLTGLRGALAGHSDIQIISECTDAAGVLLALREHSPQVLLLSSDVLDEQLEKLSSLTDESRDTSIVLLTDRKDMNFIQGALQRGARGVIQRERPVHQIPVAIRKVTNGELWFERGVASLMLTRFVNHNGASSPDADERKIASITTREHEVIALACQGLKNKEISYRLHISEATVSHHLTSIFRKLELEDRVSLILFAVKKRLVAL